MDTKTLILLILVICGYVLVSYSMGEFTEEMVGFNRYISFVLSLIFTPFLVWVVVVIIDDIRMR
jgi:uncharacterized membrane protein YhdT